MTTTYYAQIDVAGSVAAAMGVIQRRHIRVACRIVDRHGPAGWPVIELTSADAGCVRRALTALGYGDEVAVEQA